MHINTLVQLNNVGLRRAGISRESINGLRQMLKIAFREKHSRPITRALADLPREILAVPEVQEVIAFCKSSKRGVARFVPWSRQKNLLSANLPVEE
jgi:acyl-[acyl carrier protein]--UDP-N-acetylglucosamine O-acyltransferase